MKNVLYFNSLIIVAITDALDRLRIRYFSKRAAWAYDRGITGCTAIRRELETATRASFP
jgi:hypothetical protein